MNSARCLLHAVALSVAAALTMAAPVMAQQTSARADATQVAALTRAAEEQAFQKLLLDAATKYFPSDERAVAPKRIFRLTRDQIDATAKSLLPQYVTTSIKATMAKDSLQMNYEYADLLSFSPANLAALTAWVKDIAARVQKDPLGVVDCKASRNAKDCLDAGARKFVTRAYRGDVAPEKLDALAKFYVSGVDSVGHAQATAELVEVVLNSPDFLFRKELDAGRGRMLSSEQLLQSLTYTITDAPPEALAFDTARAGSYVARRTAEDTTLQTIVRSKEAREKLVRFFKAWLEVKEPGAFTISDKVFPEFTPKLASAMLDETDRFLRTQLAKDQPTLADVTEATQSIISPETAALYGIGAPSGAATKSVSLDAAQRRGIFTQPAVIASHSGPTNTRPIKRGVFWVRKVLCMEMEPPPPGIDTNLYEQTGLTERERIEQLTTNKACAGCHKLIDPLGFFQEHYDALGRWRTTDNGFPVNTRIKVGFLDEGDATTTTPVEALKLFTNSLMFKQCFVRQMFRYYLGRNEEPSDDPFLRQMFIAFAQNDSLLDLVRMLALSDRMSKRT
jgi:hypothetical protein